MGSRCVRSPALSPLAPGETSALSARPAHAANQPPPAPLPAWDAGAHPSGTPVVTIYGTSWCGACRAARQYLTERKIPFADKDIENDPAAAQELRDKASKMGIPTDRVPVIAVRRGPTLGS